MTAMNTTPSTVTQNVLSASESAPRSRKVYWPETWARLVSTMIPASVSTHPPNQPVLGPNALVTQVNVVPQSGVQFPVSEGGEQHRDEAGHHRHGGERAVLDHDITQRDRQGVGRCHRGEADHQRAEERQCALVEPLVLG